ncbi:hypothetical protein ACTRXD_02940 [Nitrospira sp. T9]
MQGALIGLVGLLVGALLSEYFRRKNRIESYAQKVFERRLGIYEKLHEMLNTAYRIATEVMENDKLSGEERKELISSAILKLAEFTDEHALFIDEYISVHVVATFMGAEDVLDIDNGLERAAAKSGVLERFKEAKSLIYEDSGLREIDKHYKSISRSAPDSAIIRYLKELKKNVT